ncbi:CLC2B protein, partial [Penelope pileata]|nr:CLC2B protein [Penelope pileata]
WVGFQGKCYYFSKTYSDWNSSRQNCTDEGASLAIIDNEEEKAFLLEQMGLGNHWIGLHRAEGAATWTWIDGTTFTNWFELRGESGYAYLNKDRIGAGLSHTKKKWVCSKPDEYVLWNR